MKPTSPFPQLTDEEIKTAFFNGCDLIQYAANTLASMAHQLKTTKPPVEPENYTNILTDNISPILDDLLAALELTGNTDAEKFATLNDDKIYAFNETMTKIEIQDTIDHWPGDKEALRDYFRNQ